MRATISGTYNLPVLPEFRNIQQQAVYLFCDTSQGAVNINLPEISKFEGFWNIEIHISDLSDNSWSNPIFINAGGSDTVNQLPYEMMQTDGGSCKVHIVSANKWLLSASYSTENGGDYDEKIKTIQAELKISSSLNYFKEYIYTTGNLTRMNIWTSESKTTKLYQVDYNYTGNDLTSTNTTRISDNFTYTKEFDYDGEGNLLSIKVEEN